MLPSCRTCLVAVFLLLPVALGADAQAQGPPLPPLPDHGPAPLLYVRLGGPAGMHVTFFQGQAPPRDFAAPVTVGLRPGYLHRVRLTGLTEHPGVSLSPTLEVRGTIHLPAKQNPYDYPAPVVFTEQDIEQVLAGAYLTKVVFLENPETAIGVATRPDQPLEWDLPAARDLLAEARALGRPVLVVRLGQRDVSTEELSHCSVPETILLPGQKTLMPPPVPPTLPAACFPVYDPFLGPRPPEEEVLHDGGDSGRPAGLDASGQVQGVDPSDTVARYSDSHGRLHVTHSNRVCLCVPRFAVLRSLLPPVGFAGSIGPAGALLVRGQEQVRELLPPLLALQNEQLAAMKGRLQPVGAIGTQGVARLLRLEVLNAEVVSIGLAEALGTVRALQLTEVERVRLVKQIELARELSNRKAPEGVVQIQSTAVVGRVQGLEVVSATAETRELTICCNEVPHPPEKPLVLFKWCDCQGAKVGDTVTFYIKYSNHGGLPISDVAVIDSLTGRLEYVPGSARTDRDAVFTLQENEAGSVILRWEVGGRLLPGQSGVVSFQARIR
jgi:uncharacterized repeat protein (TIGR01451 family)